ncbi:putative DNA-binding protein [Desulfohalotomaculum tongense]|uniref:ribbon-helix-helix domain-containing protein n=1 Tax=Desulforadius tongensis TaxID=1216062 RepID=UPI00195A9649|nr:ribbon-helix-helix domain-containing protein [Desulforadius tongensis]MBM7853710.1 putative DNA-binding protein [Desulforadius tongensis]
MTKTVKRPKVYVSFQVRLSPELKEELAKKSYETGVSQGAIVESALRYYFQTNQDPRKDTWKEQNGKK